MNLVVDSSVWIEWLIDGPLSARYAQMIPSAADCVVPTIVQHEVAKWLLRERDRNHANGWLAFTSECQVVALDTRIAVRAAELSIDYKLAMADSIIYATALIAEAGLITGDAHFQGLKDVTFVEK